jgi:hypothetical protein
MQRCALHCTRRQLKSVDHISCGPITPASVAVVLGACYKRPCLCSSAWRRQISSAERQQGPSATPRLESRRRRRFRAPRHRQAASELVSPLTERQWHSRRRGTRSQSPYKVITRGGLLVVIIVSLCDCLLFVPPNPGSTWRVRRNCSSLWPARCLWHRNPILIPFISSSLLYPADQTRGL